MVCFAERTLSQKTNAKASRWYVKNEERIQVCKATSAGTLEDCQDADFGSYSPEKGYIGGHGNWITFVEPNVGIVTCGLDDTNGIVENDGCIVTLEHPYESVEFTSLLVNEKAEKAWVGLSNDGWLTCSLTQEGVYADCTHGETFGKVYDIVVSPDGDNLYVITPDLTQVMYCQGSLSGSCTPVLGLDASGRTGHVLISFASPDIVYVQHISLEGDMIYVLERCDVLEPNVFANCQNVKESTAAYFLDLVFANDGQSVYIASPTEGKYESTERFFNPFTFLASLLTFRKPGPNVYVTQHVDICHGGYCNITIEDVMEFTLGNITYDYSKQRTFVPIEDDATTSIGYQWHICNMNAAFDNITASCTPVNLSDAVAVTRPIVF